MVNETGDEIADMLKDRGAIRYGDFLLASGQRSRWYIDIKTALTDPHLLDMIARRIADRHTFEVVAGVAVGAVPLAVAVSLASGRPYAIIRKEEKRHGTGGNIIGDVNGRSALLVEDVVTTGRSVLSGLKALRKAGALVREVVCVVDREEGGYDLLLKEGVHLHPLLKFSDILNEQ
ncbi:MAG: orotate phosphoribosyltransferase [Methanoculleaceae archaeon]